MLRCIFRTVVNDGVDTVESAVLLPVDSQDAVQLVPRHGHYHRARQKQPKAVLPTKSPRKEPRLNDAYTQS